MRGECNSAVNAAAVTEAETGQRTSYQVPSPWEKDTNKSEEGVDLGYPRNLNELYETGELLGKGGNGEVHLVTHKSTGAMFACKTLPKKLQVEPGKVSQKKADNHLQALKNEIEVMRTLRGTLNVAYLEQVFEDDTHVHILMENCRGGELLHTIGQKPYTEQTVASVMRAVLRTLAQCHSHHILHLDVKPGNFMLLDTSDTAPLKAIDFGLAKPYKPEDLPLSDLGLEGTPWYMAPEALSSQVTPAVDIWAAGVMAYQLLTGHFPFNDKKNPMRPAVNAIWKSLLTDKVKFDKSYWDDISDEGKDFVKILLEKDPSKRPTAKEALKHPWLAGGSVEDRFSGKSKGLKGEVVQRIQRYGQASLVKRTLLESLAAEILDTEGELEDGEGPPTPSMVTIPESNLTLKALKDHLELMGGGHSVDYTTLQRMLHKLGYRLHSDEVEHLMRAMDIGNDGHVTVGQFLASQMDWHAVERYHKEVFESAAVQVFNNMDTDGDGKISTKELCRILEEKLPMDEIGPAVEVALAELDNVDATTHSGNLDLDGFMKLLRCPSQDSLQDLSQYDAKLSVSGSVGSAASLDSLLGELERSIRDGSLHNSRQWKDLEKSVKDSNLHNTPEWRELEKSVKGAKALMSIFRKSMDEGPSSPSLRANSQEYPASSKPWNR
mmetsp:Transcript_24687/g.68694  ORF Transcript_24687/g.68694 Transcript_24687/m.68694 type:complete len:663 (+) Transcript_24687:1100-3088(+)